ncbi:MAG: hypothetical protein V1676_05065 [Candidatus Diapherotrites archaeon]
MRKGLTVMLFDEGLHYERCAAKLRACTKNIVAIRPDWIVIPCTKASTGKKIIHSGLYSKEGGAFLGGYNGAKFECRDIPTELGNPEKSGKFIGSMRKEERNYFKSMSGIDAWGKPTHIQSPIDKERWRVFEELGKLPPDKRREPELRLELGELGKKFSSQQLWGGNLRAQLIRRHKEVLNKLNDIKFKPKLVRRLP